VADSEVSGIRGVSLDGKGVVKTLIGRDLFWFGDQDGPAPQARLQHALGVQFVDGKLYIADTYNSKIKMLDLSNGLCVTFAGGKGTDEFNEPGGVSAAFGKLYVADTNAHRIRVVDLKTKAVSTLNLQGLKAPAPPTAEPPRKTSRGR